RPSGAYSALLHRRLDVLLDLSRTVVDRCPTCPHEVGMRCVNLLNHGASEAGNFADFLLEHHLSKLEVAQNAVQRVVMGVIRRRGEYGVRALGPVVGAGNGQSILALEVMEERTLRKTRFLTHLIDRGGGVTFLPHQRDRGLEQLLTRFAPGRSRRSM